MTQSLGEIIGHVQKQGGLDKLIHYFIVEDIIEWNPEYLERANVILSQHNWQVNGEYVPYYQAEISDYAYDIIEPRPAICHFEEVYYDNVPGVIIVADISAIGPAILLNHEGLVTTDGIAFRSLYDKKLAKNPASF